MADTSRCRGGDVAGTKKIDVTMGEAISVAAASFDPGYELGKSLDEEGQTQADLVKGYSSYGKSTGE